MPFLRFIPETTTVDFVGWRYYAFAVDGLLLLVTVVSILWHGFNMGIDFTGGVLLEVKSPHVIDIGAMRGQVDSLGFGDSQIQYFGGGACDTPADSCALISLQQKSTQSGVAASTAIKNKLGSSYTFRNAKVIGPKFS
jgi:preprotein translocase subunit SecF